MVEDTGCCLACVLTSSFMVKSLLLMPRFSSFAFDVWGFEFLLLVGFRLTSFIPVREDVVDSDWEFLTSVDLLKLVERC